MKNIARTADRMDTPTFLPGRAAQTTTHISVGTITAESLGTTLSRDGIMTSETYNCPDCDAPLTVLYERAEQTPTTVVGWCDDSGVAKVVPKHGSSTGAQL